jgi:hypothetical protein
MSRYFLLDGLGDGDDRSLAFINTTVEGFGKDDWRLTFGKPAKDLFPEPAILRFSKKHPGMKLSSFIGNTLSILIVAPPFRQAIEELGPKQTEFLPITLLDHRGRVASKDYVIVNPLGTLDCLDEKESGIKRVNDEVVGVDEYVIASSKVAKAPQLFRIREDEDEYVFGLKLMRRIQKLDLSNVLVTELRVT